MWAIEWYVGCCRVCGLLNIKAVVYVGCLKLFRLLYGMWADVL